MAGGQHLNKATLELPQGPPRQGWPGDSKEIRKQKVAVQGEDDGPDKRRLGLPDDSHRASAYLYQSQGGMYTDGHPQGILMLEPRIVRR